MAKVKVKFKKGKEANLPTAKDEGSIYFTTDTGKIFMDVSSSERKQLYDGTLTKPVADEAYQPKGTYCRNWTVALPSGSSDSKVITVTGAQFAQPPLIAKASGSDDDYAKITAVSATPNALTFTLSAATSAVLTLMVIETF